MTLAFVERPCVLVPLTVLHERSCMMFVHLIMPDPFYFNSPFRGTPDALFYRLVSGQTLTAAGQPNPSWRSHSVSPTSPACPP
jgi:hypothetical protein